MFTSHSRNTDLSGGMEGILWLTHQSRWHFVQVMDILISLLYTGTQDGWMAINGWARLFPWNQREDIGLLWRICFLGFKDDSLHLCHNVRISMWSWSIHTGVAKVLLTQQLSFLHRDPQQVLLSTLKVSSTPLPHLLFTTCFSLSVIAISYIIIP